jgi:hypothetical protein
MITEHVEFNPTAIAVPDMYRISQDFVSALPALQLQTNAHRTLHALLHATCRAMSDWHDGHIQPDQGFLRACKPLRKVVGLEAENCNRSLRDGVLQLRDTGIFDILAFAHDFSWLNWRFTDTTLEQILDDRRYGLFDASILPALRSPLDFTICSSVAIARRMRRPAFSIQVESLAAMLGKPDASWCKIKDSFIKSLMIAAAHQNLSFFLLLKCEGYRRGIDTVDVRIKRPGSLWTRDKLAKVTCTTRQYLIVDASGFVEVKLDNLEEDIAKIMQTKPK